MQIDTIMHGDCLEVLHTLPDASVDALVTDPPYGLGEAPDVAAVLGAWLAGESFVPRNRGGFMGKTWDAFVPGPEYWRAVFRVLKPGGHLVAFAGTRTEDVMGISIRLAGFERRDTLYWIHGQGFPKSLDVSKQIDKAAGARRQVVKTIRKTASAANTHPGWERPWAYEDGEPKRTMDITAPATDAARQWSGWGTALKPAVEPIILARKPLSEGTVAANVVRWGTGALNIEASRVESSDGFEKAWDKPVVTNISAKGGKYATGDKTHRVDLSAYKPAAGRWPPHLLLSHSIWCTTEACADGCPVRVLGEQSGASRSVVRKPTGKDSRGVPGFVMRVQDTIPRGVGDTGTAARFFPQFRYVAKASRRERNRGCEGLPVRAMSDWPQDLDPGASRGAHLAANHHPTVKPLALMRWLITLITPPGGIVLDPFSGSGTTLLAAQQLGMHWLGIEQEREYIAIARARLGMREEATA